MESTIDREIWDQAEAVYAQDLEKMLNGLLNSYQRNPGKDEVVRVTSEHMGEVAYKALLDALQTEPRRDIRHYDYGWHIELRSRLWEYLVRNVQRLLVSSGKGTDALVEDLLAHDIGL